MTEITEENLLAAGYREYPVNNVLDRHARAFQKRFDGPNGKRFYLDFRMWEPVGTLPLQFDAQLCCDSDTGGYLWVTLREDGIEATENRADALWEAAGSVYYEVYCNPNEVTLDDR